MNAAGRWEHPCQAGDIWTGGERRGGGLPRLRELCEPRPGACGLLGEAQRPLSPSPSHPRHSPGPRYLPGSGRACHGHLMKPHDTPERLVRLLFHCTDKEPEAQTWAAACPRPHCSIIAGSDSSSCPSMTCPPALPLFFQAAACHLLNSLTARGPFSRRGAGRTSWSSHKSVGAGRGGACQDPGDGEWVCGGGRCEKFVKNQLR